ncbi:MAG: UDP-3-O-acyl-N-acetylglucosamine deacetylase, partial [Betaproteobacteria bacterium]|nr:UDP-3-O-acyl-N-acetylglucosamine deacetylase [Betaproteobacteria bacterium]
MSFDASQSDYRTEIAAARTFGFAEKIDWLRERNRAMGGSLNNALVFSSNEVLNPGGLRFANECVRHKVLDAIGDCFADGSRRLG